MPAFAMSEVMEPSTDEKPSLTVLLTALRGPRNDAALPLRLSRPPVPPAPPAPLAPLAPSAPAGMSCMPSIDRLSAYARSSSSSSSATTEAAETALVPGLLNWPWKGEKGLDRCYMGDPGGFQVHP